MANKVHWKVLNANSVQFFFYTHLLRPPGGRAPHFGNHCTRSFTGSAFLVSLLAASCVTAMRQAAYLLYLLAASVWNLGWTLATLTMGFIVSPSSSSRMQGRCLKIGHDHCLPHPSHLLHTCIILHLMRHMWIFIFIGGVKYRCSPYVKYTARKQTVL
jgi:hypothetical protein